MYVVEWYAGLLEEDCINTQEVENILQGRALDDGSMCCQIGSQVKYANQIEVEMKIALKKARIKLHYKKKRDGDAREDGQVS